MATPSYGEPKPDHIQSDQSLP